MERKQGKSFTIVGDKISTGITIYVEPDLPSLSYYQFSYDQVFMSDDLHERFIKTDGNQMSSEFLTEVLKGAQNITPILAIQVACPHCAVVCAISAYHYQAYADAVCPHCDKKFIAVKGEYIWRARVLP